MTVEDMIAQRTGKLSAIKDSSNAAVIAKGGSAADDLSGLPAAISSIPSGGGELPELTDPATAGDVIEGKEYIDGAGAKQTGALVICDTVQADGYFGNSGYGVSVNLVSVLDGSTKILTLPEPNLLAENIKIGVSIFGVAGSAAGGGMVSASGTFTLSEDAQAPEVIHNLGVIPDLVIVEAADHDNTAYSIFGFVAVRPGFLSCEQFGGVILINNATGMESSGLANTNGKNAFNNGLSDTNFVCAYNSGNYKYRAGWTYKWKVFAGLT